MLTICCASCHSYPAKFNAQQWFLGLCCVSFVKPDFTCRVCGAATLCAPDPPQRAICPDCCEKADGHKYEHDGGREYFCLHCGEQPSYEWYAERSI